MFFSISVIAERNKHCRKNPQALHSPPLRPWARVVKSDANPLLGGRPAPCEGSLWLPPSVDVSMCCPVPPAK